MKASKACINQLMTTTYESPEQDAMINHHLGWLDLDASRLGLCFKIDIHHLTNSSNTQRFYQRTKWAMNVDKEACRQLQ